MDISKNKYNEYKLKEDYSSKELALIKQKQINEFKNIINNPSEEFNLYTLIFLEVLLSDIVLISKDNISISSITKRIDELVSKALCITNLDKKAKKILIICNEELRKNDKISVSTKSKLNNIKLEYYKTVTNQ